MKAHIIYLNYLTPDGTKMSIGGIQTYITSLSKVLIDLGFEIHIYQQSSVDFDVKYHQNYVHGVKIETSKAKKISRLVFNRYESTFNKKDDIIIFGSEVMNVSCPGYKSIAIQHGISWDIPCEGEVSQFEFFKQYFIKALRALKLINRIAHTETLVCVDYNFINWYRALVVKPQVNLLAVPNFTDIPSSESLLKTEKCKIIFARRFFPYRGTRIFARAAKRILEKYQNVEITVAGSGPDETYMREILGNNQRVDFIQYSSNDSLKIHANKDIAVVPTVGSEGTSLSLLEAMASKCAVVCSDVGGMTNIVLDGYNGLIISATEDSIYNALSKLIDNVNLRKSIADNAYLTVSQSFTLNKWESAWIEAIKKTMKWNQ